jgi:hypothetical protein
VITVLKTHRPQPSRNKSTRSASRSLLTGGAGALLATLALCAGGTGTAAAAGCPNEQLRVENHSTTLPDCRAYEQVTPTFKEGFGQGSAQNEFSLGEKVNAFAADGEAMAFSSQGNFSNNGQAKPDNDYLAKRTPSGWTTLAADPPLAEYYGLGQAAVLARTPDLETNLFVARRPADPSDAERYYLRNVDGTVTEVGPLAPIANFTEPPGVFSTGAPEYGGEAVFAAASEDLSHIAFFEGGSAVNFPGDELIGEDSLLEYVGTGGDPRVVSVNNEGKVFDSCGVHVHYSYQTAWMSRDGSRIAFGQVACEGRPAALYERVNSETTVELSRSECTRTSGDPGGVCNAPADAALVGATPDDSVTYFTTSQQLVNSDIDQGQDLYACVLPAGAIAPQGSINSCPTIEPISVTGTAAGANVENVLYISKDGSHIVFTASGVLPGATTNGDGQHAVEGATNLYMYDRDAQIGERLKFVSDLCSGSGMSGAAADALCPQSPSANDAAMGANKLRPDVQMAANSRYVLLETYARLDTGDTDEGEDVYRYDTETGSLVRISVGRDGYNDNGNATNDNALLESVELTVEPRLDISENGEKVFFTTSEALVPQDTNNARDVYEWDAGQIYLISDGVAPLGSKLQSISPSGRDVLFITAAQLTWSDGDTAEDVYDARVGGGFPVPVTPAACSGEACQGSPPTMGAPPSPGSLTLAGAGNVATGSSASSSSPLTVSSTKAITGPGGTLSVKVAKSGRLAISGPGLKSTSVPITKAGTVTVKILLTNQARAKLRKRHALKISAKVLFTPEGGQTAIATVALTFKEAHSSKSASKARKGHS